MTDALNEKDKWLAAEFAMGVLERDDLRLAEKRFDEDPAFRKEVEIWQNQLSPMLEDIAPVKPGTEVWDAIARRTASVEQAAKGGLWTSLAFWRGVSAVAGSLAAASIAALLFLPGIGLLDKTDPEQPLVATLTATGETPAFVARYDPEQGSLLVRVAARDTAETRVAELWLIPGDGVPRSLGLLDEAGFAQLRVSSDNQSVFSGGSTLAVSLEPEGGSPTGAPTGPVIATGKLQPF